MAAIVPSSHHPLYRWRMEQPHHWRAVARLGRERPTFIEDVFERIRRDGPLTASDLEERVGPKGPWWDWDDGKIALEELFLRGHVVARGGAATSPGSTTCPSGCCRRPSWRRRRRRRRRDARRCSTWPDERSGWRRWRTSPTTTARAPSRASRWSPSSSKPVACGRGRGGRVESAGLRPPRGHRSRRDPWPGAAQPVRLVGVERDRTERLFDFHYRIEIYTPQPKRVYGYYVLPFLLDGQLVGRIDLKADRANGILRVQGAYAELGVPLAEVGRELADELHSMAGWLELDVVATTDRGELAPELARAGVARIEGDAA